MSQRLPLLQAGRFKVPQAIFSLFLIGRPRRRSSFFNPSMSVSIVPPQPLPLFSEWIFFWPSLSGEVVPLFPEEIFFSSQAFDFFAVASIAPGWIFTVLFSFSSRDYFCPLLFPIGAVEMDRNAALLWGASSRYSIPSSSF